MGQKGSLPSRKAPVMLEFGAEGLQRCRRRTPAVAWNWAWGRGRGRVAPDSWITRGASMSGCEASDRVSEVKASAVVWNCCGGSTYRR